MSYNQRFNANQRSLAMEISQAQDQAKAEADSINNWYELRRNQALMELERLETAYNERMAEHSMEWAQKLSALMEQEMLEPVQPACGYTENILPIPKLVRQQNVQYLPSSDRNFMDDLEYLNDINSFAPATEDADIVKYSGRVTEGVRGNSREQSSSEFPDFTDTTVEQHVIDVLAHMNAVAIVSDDEGPDDDAAEML